SFEAALDLYPGCRGDCEDAATGGASSKAVLDGHRGPRGHCPDAAIRGVSSEATLDRHRGPRGHCEDAAIRGASSEATREDEAGLTRAGARLDAQRLGLAEVLVLDDEAGHCAGEEADAEPAQRR